MVGQKFREIMANFLMLSTGSREILVVGPRRKWMQCYEHGYGCRMGHHEPIACATARSTSV